MNYTTTYHLPTGTYPPPPPLFTDHFVYADRRSDGDHQVDESLQPFVSFVKQLLVEDPQAGQDPDGPPEVTGSGHHRENRAQHNGE